MMPLEMNIYQKLAKIRRPVEILQKNRAGYGYKYVTEDVILAKITGLMDKLGVSLIPRIMPNTTEVMPYHYVKTKVLKTGERYEEHVNEILVKADMEWQWINNDDPDDRIIVSWTTVGQQADASQAFGSGLSYSSRYFLLKYFNVATSDDDPDRWRSMQREAEEAEKREITAKIIEQVHTLVSAHLTEKPADREMIAETVKKYAKDKNGKASGNYNLITDPATAGQLLTALNKAFGIQE